MTSKLLRLIVGATVLRMISGILNQQVSASQPGMSSLNLARSRNTRGPDVILIAGGILNPHSHRWKPQIIAFGLPMSIKSQHQIMRTCLQSLEDFRLLAVCEHSGIDFSLFIA
jgi:hypothetical protein